MKTLLLSLTAITTLISAASAEPVRLTELQLDRIAGGLSVGNGNGNGNGNIGSTNGNDT